MRLLPLFCLLIFLGACSRSPQADRDITRAETLYQASKKQRENPAALESALKEVLVADPFHGQAHHDLGVLHLMQGHLYDAAQELSTARKLLEGSPEVRYNLGLALDRGGKQVEALEAFKSALEVRPGYLPAVQMQTLLRIRRGQWDERIAEDLRRIESEGESKEWKAWASRQLQGRERRP